TQQLYRFVWNRVFNPGLAGRTPAATQQLYRFVVGPGLRPGLAGQRPAAKQQLYRLVWDRVFDPGLAGRRPAATQQLYRLVWDRVFDPGLAGRTPAATQQLYRFVWDRVFDPVLRVGDPQPLNSSIGSCGTGSSTRSCGPKTRSHTAALQVRVGPGLRPGLAGRRPAATQHLFYRLVWDRVFNPILRAEDPQPHNSSSIGSCGTGSSTRSCGPKTRSHTIIATH